MDIKIKKSSPDIGIKTNHVNINMKASGGIGTKDHSKLTNLDYEHSGHTGFASAVQIQELLEKINKKQNTLTAGDNISIIDDIISVTGLDKSEIYIGPDEPTDPNIKIWIDTTEVAQEFYTKQEIDAKGYATETWVSAQGYLTQHQDLSEYAKKSEIPTKVSAFENDAGYLTQHQDLSDYALKTELPTEYVKSATVQGNKLTLTNKDNTTVDFEPSGGGGGSGVKVYKFYTNKYLSNEDKANLKAIKEDTSIPVYIDDIIVNKTYDGSFFLQFRTYQIKGVGQDEIRIYKVDFNSEGEVTSQKIQIQMGYYVATSSTSVDGTILTTSNLSTEVPRLGSWSATVPNDSNLYNAKEMVLFAQDAYGNQCQAYYNFSYNTSGGESSLGTDFQNVAYTFTASNRTYVSWQYNGNEIISNLGQIILVLYKG